jgi:hypothetical protein
MNERFEGLSLPQLAELLHGPVLPPAVSFVPETIGWQILGAWAVAIVTLVTTHALLRWRRNRYRREAIDCLRRLEERAATDPAAVQEVGALLKRTAMTAYSRERVAPLFGAAWAGFLVQTARDDAAVSAAAAQLASVAYRPATDPALVFTAAQRWIRRHRD